MARGKDHLDGTRGGLAHHDAAIQSQIEAWLDVPLTSAIRCIGRTGNEADAERVVAIHGYVGRMLRDAYGADAYAKGARLSHADVYAAGVMDTHAEVAGMLHDLAGSCGDIAAACQSSDERAGDLGDRLRSFAEGVERHERRLAWTCAAAGGIGAVIPVLAALALMWACGHVTFR